MNSTRKTAFVAGVFYLTSFISIPTLALYGPLKTHRDYIISSGTNTGVLWGGFLEVIVALAGIGTAVTLFPVVRRQNEGMALGFVAIRTLEAGMIYTGVVTLHSLVTLRQAGATGADAASLVTTGKSLVATYNWTFLLGQSLSPAISAMVLGTLMYQSGLVPPAPSLVGPGRGPPPPPSLQRCGGPSRSTPPLAGLTALPVALWEFSLGVYLVVKGFKPCPITDAMLAAGTTPA